MRTLVNRIHWLACRRLRQGSCLYYRQSTGKQKWSTRYNPVSRTYSLLSLSLPRDSGYQATRIAVETEHVEDCVTIRCVLRTTSASQGWN